MTHLNAVIKTPSFPVYRPLSKNPAAYHYKNSFSSIFMQDSGRKANVHPEKISVGYSLFKTY